jgi:hypothetical protein
MELEKLKEIWTSLDDRMKQQEGLKTAIIKEMLLSKSDKTLSRMINWGYFGLALSLCLTPVLIWVYMCAYRVATTVPMFVSAFIIVFFVFTLGIIGLVKLHKIDFSNPVSVNIIKVSKYKVFYKRMSLIACLFVLIFIVFCIMSYLQLQHMESWRLVGILFSIPFGIVLGYWEYKRMGMKNINSILKSLEELKELEEET